MAQSKKEIDTTAAKVENSGEELVEYIAPLLPGTEKQGDIFVGVNGETIRIKRGVCVKIKRKFAEVLQNAQAQEMAAYKTMRIAQDQSVRAVAEM